MKNKLSNPQEPLAQGNNNIVGNNNDEVMFGMPDLLNRNNRELFKRDEHIARLTERIKVLEGHLMGVGVLIDDSN